MSGLTREDIAAGIDWFAVECAVTGTPMRLNAFEKKAALRRLLAKGVAGPRIAELMHTARRHVERMKQELPDAEQVSCPVCGQSAWLTADGLEPHTTGTGHLEECLADEDAWAETVVALAARLQSGDRTVWEALAGFGETHLRVLLLAALAGFRTDGEPYAWLQQSLAVAG